MKHVNVIVWSDFVCPWCWIAKRRAERAAKAVVGDIAVSFEYRAYRLGRGEQPTDYRRAIERKLGNAQVAARLMSAVSDQAAQENLIYSFDAMRFGDTTLAHALVKSVESAADQHRLIELISMAGISDGRDIFDRDVLRGIGQEAGLDVNALKLDDPLVHKVIARDERDAGRIANGVPLFVFNDSLYLSGAQPLDVFEQAIRRAAEQAPLEEVATDDGASCSIDGCRPS